MNVLVTGAAGFIGRHLVRALHVDGHRVTALDISDMTEIWPSNNISRLQADITNETDIEDIVKKIGSIEATLHLTGQRSSKNNWDINVRGTHNVLQLLRKIGCPKIVFFSSAHVYGISPKYMPTDESHPLALLDTYTTTKIAGEDLCKLFYENHGISYTTLRLWNAYGPGQSKDYFIGAKIEQAKAGDLTIRNAGVTKDWVHIDDVVAATLLAMKSQYVGPLNVGTGKETSLQEIVNAIATAFDRKVVEENVPDEGPTRMQCDWRRIKATLGWEPKTSFASGLQELIAMEKNGLQK